MNYQTSFRDWLPNIFAFIFGISIAWFQEWETSDLIWSLWLSSLVVGYLTIISATLSGAIIDWKLSNTSDLSATKRRTAELGASGVALFHLVFFSLHFCGFHAAHAGFLSEMFPLDGVSSEVFFDDFTNPVGLWVAALEHVFPLYGVFAICVVVAERKHLLGPLIRSYKVIQLASKRDRSGDQTLREFASQGRGHKAAKETFKRPYINVMKTHVLIIFFGAASGLGITSNWLFIIAYFVYFFPWQVFKRNVEDQQSRSMPPECASR